MKKHFWLIIILVGATILRFYHNTSISLWHDEAFSALLIKYPWHEMMYRIGLDVHPPAYYIFLRFWYYIFGDSLLSLRSFSVLFGVGTVWAAWLFVKTAFKSEKMALWAAVLVALSPFQLQYVTEARMYTFGAFFAVLAAYFLVKALHYDESMYKSEELHMPNLPQTIHARQKMWWNYLYFSLCTIIIIYTHYYLFFTAAALIFYALVYLLFHHAADKTARYKKFLPLLTSIIVIVASYLPWVKTLLFQVKQVGAGYWIPPMDVWSIPSTLWDMLLSFSRDVNNSNTQKALILATLFTLFFLYKFIRKTQNFEKWLVLFSILAPFAGSIMFMFWARLHGSSSSVFLVRYFLFASTFYTIALVVWLEEIRTPAIAPLLLGLYCLTNVVAISSYWKDTNVSLRVGMNAAAKYLYSNVGAQDKIYVGTSFEFFNLKYYINRFNQRQFGSGLVGFIKQATSANKIYSPVTMLPTPLLFTGGTEHARDISHFAGSALLTDLDLIPQFSRDVKTGDTVWLVWTYAFGSNKPDLPKNWVQLNENEYPEIRPYLGTSIYVDQYKVN